MAIPCTIQEREYRKFTELNGETAVRTTSAFDTGSLLADVKYDAIQASYPNATTEVYEFYEGGLSGTLNATVTIVYITSDKDDIKYCSEVLNALEV